MDFTTYTAIDVGCYTVKIDRNPRYKDNNAVTVTHGITVSLSGFPNQAVQIEKMFPRITVFEDTVREWPNVIKRARCFYSKERDDIFLITRNPPGPNSGTDERQDERQNVLMLVDLSHMTPADWRLELNLIAEGKVLVSGRGNEWIKKTLILYERKDGFSIPITCSDGVVAIFEVEGGALDGSLVLFNRAAKIRKIRNAD